MEVMQNQEFLMLPCDEVCKLLASDDINVPTEESIFEAVLKWARHDLLNRKKFLAVLLSHIKLPLMAPQVGFCCIWSIVTLYFLTLISTVT